MGGYKRCCVWVLHMCVICASPNSLLQQECTHSHTHTHLYLYTHRGIRPYSTHTHTHRHLHLCTPVLRTLCVWSRCQTCMHEREHCAVCTQRERTHIQSYTHSVLNTGIQRIPDEHALTHTHTVTHTYICKRRGGGRGGAQHRHPPYRGRACEVQYGSVCGERRGCVLLLPVDLRGCHAVVCSVVCVCVRTGRVGGVPALVHVLFTVYCS